MKPYYEQDGITIYHGDCREVLLTLPRGFASAVVSDPPYGTEDDGGGYGRRQVHNPAGGKSRTIAGDRDLTVFMEALTPTLRATAPDAWLSYFCAAKRRDEVNGLLKSVGLGLFGEVIWDKGAPGLGYHIRYAHESVVVCKRGEPVRPPNALLSVVRAPIDPTFHPHAKPVALMCRLVEWACPSEGVVLDPFMGSGSTLVAAKMLGRRAVGIEVCAEHCDTAIKKLGQGVLFGIGGAA